MKQKIREQEEKSKKKKEGERGGRILVLACSGCCKPEGKDRKKAEKE